MDRLEGGDDYDLKIRRNIARCSFFIPLISAQTNLRAEGYFRREWNFAVDRTKSTADGALFIIPVAIDDTLEGAALVPEIFRSAHWTRLPGGQVTPEFVQRLRELAGKH